MRSQTTDHEHTIADTKRHGRARARRRVPVNDRAEQDYEQQTRKLTQRADKRGFEAKHKQTLLQFE
jgi:hypothetical protein